MHKQRVALLVIALLGMTGTLLPWLTMPMGVSIRGTETGNGRIALALFVPAVFMALVGNWKKSWQRGGPFLVFTLPSLLASAVAGLHIVNFYGQRASGSSDIELLQLASLGWGLYLVAAAGIALVVFASVLQGPAQRKSTALPAPVGPSA
jgi:hypothetical protein